MNNDPYGRKKINIMNNDPGLMKNNIMNNDPYEKTLL